MRSDLAPIKKRFPVFGTPKRAHWCGVVLNAESGRVPGPSDVRLVGVVELTAGAFTEVMKDMGDSPVPDAPKGLPDEIVGFLPEKATWLRSDRLDQSISRGLYTASFHVDTANHAVIIDCVNPTAGSEVVVTR